MSRSLNERASGLWAFALAASAAPLTYLLAAPYGLVCGGCPLGGACLLASPLMFAAVIVIKSTRGVKGLLMNPGARLAGKEPPRKPESRASPFIEVEDEPPEEP